MQLRNFMINTTSSWVTTPMEVLSSTDNGIVFMKGDIITILTNIGSPVSASTQHSAASAHGLLAPER